MKLLTKLAAFTSALAAAAVLTGCACCGGAKCEKPAATPATPAAAPAAAAPAAPAAPAK